MISLYSIIFLLFSGTATSQWTESDARNEGIRCFEQIIHEGDISNLLIDVTTPERIDQFCRRHDALEKCTRENEHLMSVEENTEYLKKTSSVHNFYVNVCPPGTDITAEYKGNSPCFKFVRNEILSCGSDLPDLDSYNMKNNLRRRCCALKNHRECLKEVALEHCGKEAASVIEKMHFRYFDSKMKECNATSYKCDENGHKTERSWTTVSKGYSHPPTKWHVPSTREYEHDTKKDFRSTTVADWGRSTETSEHKKPQHHSGAAAVHSAIGILGCFASILLLKL